MDLANFILSWTPLMLIMVLAVGLERQALELALWGTIYTVGLVLFWFKTSPVVVVLAALDGVLTNTPLLLVIYFGKPHVATAELLDASPSVLASGLAVGSAVGSISSPLKIALAASMCGADGKEGLILTPTVPLGIGVALVLGIFLRLML